MQCCWGGLRIELFIHVFHHALRQVKLVMSFTVRFKTHVSLTLVSHHGVIILRFRVTRMPSV